MGVGDELEAALDEQQVDGTEEGSSNSDGYTVGDREAMAVQANHEGRVAKEVR